MSCGREWRDERATGNIKQWILRKLGCEVIGVELTDDQLEDAVMDAQEYWLMWVGRVRAADISITSSLEYPADVIAPDLDSVVDVYFDAYDANLWDIFGWADVEINPFQWVYDGSGGYSGIAQYQMYRKDAQKIMSSDRDWQWDKARRMLVISPRENQISRAKVMYLSRCFNYEYLSTYEWRLFRQSCLVNAMKTLATIRMKFPEKPGANGSFSMDGESMWANAEAMEMNIEEKMGQMSHPTGILLG